MKKKPFSVFKVLFAVWLLALTWFTVDNHRQLSKPAPAPQVIVQKEGGVQAAQGAVNGIKTFISGKVNNNSCPTDSGQMGQMSGGVVDHWKLDNPSQWEYTVNQDDKDVSLQVPAFGRLTLSTGVVFQQGSKVPIYEVAQHGNGIKVYFYCNG